MRALAVLLCALPLMGCVLNPAAEFRTQYETNALGENFHKREGRGYAPFNPPETTPAGTVIYSLYADYRRRGPNECVLFYETRDDVIIRAWHEGKHCLKIN